MIKIPFDKKEIEIGIDQNNLLGILEPKARAAIPNIQGKITELLNKPVNSKPLSEAVRGKTKICIVVTDITRPCPDDLLLPLIVKELEKGGINKENITILVATGLHRPNTDDELMTKLGRDIFNQIKVVNHVASDKSNLINLGVTSLGCPIWVNKLVVEADFTICTGIIEPHFFAGFSGGRKGVSIGVAGEETIKFEHDPKVFDHPKTRIGNLDGNIFHINAMEIAKIAGLNFIVNVVLNGDGEIGGVVAGEPESAFHQGVEIAREIYQVEIEEQADIAIAGVGYPKSTNLYQGTRGASCIAFSPYPVVKKGGLVITPVPAEEGPGEGLGEQRFYKIMKNARDLESLIKDIKINGYPAGGQRAYLLALTLKHAELVITNTKAPAAVENMFMKAMPRLEDALKYGFARYGSDAKIIVLPQSVQVMTVKSEPTSK
jgi:nickel-dependent lactate racemase